ncbi:hypothetical protein NFI96_025639, partial [Prochilodus magdalenae]
MHTDRYHDCPQHHVTVTKDCSGVVPDCHGVTQNGSGSSSVTSPALVLVETPNESVVSTKITGLLSHVQKTWCRSTFTSTAPSAGTVHPPSPTTKMRTDEASGTVLHRLIQEQLRYGNPTDAHTLLAIQQQALRRGGRGSSSSGGAGSSQSSSESLSQEEPQSPKLSARQEPQGQEYQADYQHSESYHLYSHHHEQLPTYEQAKVHSQYLASQWYHNGQPSKDYMLLENTIQPYEDERWDAKCGHARSLSERLMQLSLQRKAVDATPASISSSSSYPQIAGYNASQHLASKDKHGPWQEYPLPLQPQATTLKHAQEEYEHFYSAPPPPFHNQHNRLVPPVQSPEARHVFSAAPPAGREVLTHGSNQMELLMKENERLRQELEGHAEKAVRIQKVRVFTTVV